MGPDSMILVFWMLSFKPTFSLSSFTLIKRLFSSSSYVHICVCLMYICIYVFFYVVVYKIYIYAYVYICIYWWCACSVTQLWCACSVTLCDPIDCGPNAPLSMEFSRQEYWSGLPCYSLGDLPDPRTEPTSPVLASGFFSTEAPWNPFIGGRS